MPVNLDILRKIGLSEGEIKVYGALIAIGPSSLNTIHERVGIERRNIYDILNKLVERGLVSYIFENKRRVFQPTHPSKILSYVDEKAHDLESIRAVVRPLVPMIEREFKHHVPRIRTEHFRGFEGVKAVWDDMLDYTDIYWIGSGRYVPKRLPGFFATWNRKRVEKKIRIHNIFRHELRKETKLLELEEGRFLPKEFSGNPVVLGTYGDKVFNMMLGNEFFAVVIESKEMAESYRGYFTYLWKNVAKP